MSAFKTDGDFTTASAVGKPRISFPIAGDVTAQIITQSFMQLFANFTPTALGTVHPDIATAFLVSEAELQDMGGGVARWDRIYSTIPATRDEYESYSYTFPGFVYFDGGITGDGRQPQTNHVPSRIAYEYFLIAASGQPYTTVSDMIAAEAVDGQRYVFTAYPNTDTEYLVDSTTYPGFLATTPSRPTYEALIGTEIVAENSTYRRWMGNIWEVTTRYVVAQ